METLDPPRRPYRQTARAAAAEETRRRILAAFIQRLREGWYDEITLETVALDAGVTVQTILRRFAGKEGLLEAAAQWMGQEVRINRHLARPTPSAVAAAVAKDYEQTGDLILRLLDQEGRYPSLKYVCDLGRRSHREWLAEVFVDALQGPSAEARLDGLVVATDLYSWKLVRRDLGRSQRWYRNIVEHLIEAALHQDGARAG